MPNLDTLPISTSELSARSGVEVRQINRLVARGALKAAGKLPGRTGANLFDPNALDVISLIETGSPNTAP